jgi:uncharacterized protein
VTSARPANFTLQLRLPAWCAAAQVRVNGESVDTATAERGYLAIQREWQSGDVVQLDLPMPVERIYAHPAVRADIGRVALRRGPIVYCLEQMDQSAPLSQIVLPSDTPLVAHFVPELLGGVVVVEGAGAVLDAAGWEDRLYQPAPPTTKPSTIRAIPYYAWDNRSPGAMTVWLPVGR